MLSLILNLAAINLINDASLGKPTAAEALCGHKNPPPQVRNRPEIAPMPHQHATSATLNTLIATLIDSVEGYQKSARDVNNTRYADMFKARAAERKIAVAQLQAAVVAAGGEPEDDGTMLGSLHRGLQSLREAVSNQDDAAIIAEIERGEDYLKDKFETALDSSELSPRGLRAVQEAWASVRAGHDEMAQLQHALTFS